MNCKDFLERLYAYLDAEMSQPERQAFLSHAQNCRCPTVPVKRSPPPNEFILSMFSSTLSFDVTSSRKNRMIQVPP